MEKKSFFMVFHICVITFVVTEIVTTEVIYMEAKALFRGPYFSYASFGLHEYSKLEVDGATLKYAQSAAECSKGCAGNMSCFSFNFGTKPIFNYEGVSQYLCELLPTDKYKSPSKFRMENNFHHYSIKTECSKNPCPLNTNCIANYFNDTYVCEDNINECATQTHKCNSSANCTDTLGSYYCTCHSGFTGDGFNCEDINECARSDLNNCHREANCLNNVGSYSCSCQNGFSGDGKTVCNDIDECVVTPNICPPGVSVCRNTFGSFTCRCLNGYISDSQNTCVDFDECAHNTSLCHSAATCTNTPGSYSCACNASFVGDGNNCSRQFNITVTSSEPEAIFIVDGKTIETNDDGIIMMFLNDVPPHDPIRRFDFKNDRPNAVINLKSYIDHIPLGKVVLSAISKHDRLPIGSKFAHDLYKLHEVGGSKLPGQPGNRTWILVGRKGTQEPIIEVISKNKILTRNVKVINV